MEIFKTTIGELFDFYVEHEEETFMCGTVLHMFDPTLSRVDSRGNILFEINVIEVFQEHFPIYVTGSCFGGGETFGETFEWYIDPIYYDPDIDVRDVRISLMTDIIGTYGRDVELEFEIVKLVN